MADRRAITTDLRIARQEFRKCVLAQGLVGFHVGVLPFAPVLS